MRIGLDLDNTLVCYERVFLLEAKRQGLLPELWSGSKQEIKQQIISQYNGEKLWQTLQGQVYGPCMEQAELFPGVARFLMRCKELEAQVFIVSQKTKFGHFDPTKTPLRKTAINWMTSKGFFNPAIFGLDEGRVFFFDTRREKVRHITSLELDAFVDDLEEVFLEEEFPDLTRILFNTKPKSQKYDAVSGSWIDIGNHLLGPLTDQECLAQAQTFCPETIESVKRLSGRGNSRVYQVVTQKNKQFFLKVYPDLHSDPRPRLQAEVRACDLVFPLMQSPKIVAFDKELNMGLFEWLEGVRPTEISLSNIDQAVEFIQKLKELHEGLEGDYPEASEACLSGRELLSQINRRFDLLRSVETAKLRHFLEAKLQPLWLQIQDRYLLRSSETSIDRNLALQEQTLSPSDFGFHNSKLGLDGRLKFFDFEYFGRDDPVKLIADFLWHPAMDLKHSHKSRWAFDMFDLFRADKDLKSRFEATWPLYGVRWSLILLNVFCADGWSKRVNARRKSDSQALLVQDRQLKKAKNVCDFLVNSNMKCPYV